MVSILQTFQFKIRQQIKLVQNPQLPISARLVLTRNLLENVAIYNFLAEKDTKKRFGLYQCYGALSWQTHSICQDKRHRFLRLKRLLNNLNHKYPYAYFRYYHLLKKRVCQRLTQQIRSQNNTRIASTKLKIMTSNKSQYKYQKRDFVIEQIIKHPITKLPFPHRMIFGKSITYFVLKYTQVNQNTYWFLTDVAHDVVMQNLFTKKQLLNLIQQVLKSIIGS